MGQLIRFLVFLVTIQIIFAGIIPLNETQRNETWKNTIILDSSCYDSHAVAYIGQIPDTGSCHRYLRCRETEEGDEGPVAVPTRCEDSNVYDIHSCECTTPETAVCFDYSNPDHEALRFKCAEPLEEDD